MKIMFYNPIDKYSLYKDFKSFKYHIFETWKLLWQ